MRNADSALYMHLDGEYLAATYGRTPVVIDRGKGATLFDADGKKYIDFGAGIAVNTLGTGDKGLIKAVTRQMKQVAHTSNVYYSEPDVCLAMMLSERTGCQKVFFGNSGAEANECAIKVARKYSFDRYGKERNRIVTLKNSFHGRTVTTLAATGQDVFHNYFFPFTDGFDYCEAGDLDALKQAVGDKTCAVMIELIQGEGGVNVLKPEYVEAVAKLCRERDLLLIVDEVQTGNGRTGSLYCCEQYNLVPDIVTTAKGLGGGLPIGACLLFDRVKDVLTKGTHGSTFGGNPTCCAAACYILEKLDEKFLSEVRQKSDYLRAKLEIMGLRVSGKGLLLGAEVKDAAKTVAACAENGLLLLTAKTKLRFLPPLNISYKELDQGLAVLAGVLKKEQA